MRIIKYILFVLVMLNLIMTTSCTWFRKTEFFHSRDADYLSACSIPPLKIPPGISSAHMDPHYPVSGGPYPPCVTPMDIRPPCL